MPSPDKYDIMGNLNNKNKLKNVFSKLPRLTMAAEILKKGSSTPGPGTYRNYVKKKKDPHNSTETRDLGFITEAKVKGKEVPLCYNSNYKLGRFEFLIFLFS